MKNSCMQNSASESSSFEKSGFCVMWYRQMILAILSWKPPKNIIKVKVFLGLVGHYRHYVICFSIIALSLKRLSQKDVKFDKSNNVNKALIN
ncbi:RNA-directed DNA polymerase-like protein [Gossypium australe]|uniref:RNA-directed DNA polymerase-like protein n=1 Tax=Gossypium australe TaxID=47621 RepID=A0A5B6VCT8_9ROSI|nr:RNA-directed DNA polymerase-like protein [Gossypium australe]